MVLRLGRLRSSAQEWAATDTDRHAKSQKRALMLRLALARIALALEQAWALAWPASGLLAFYLGASLIGVSDWLGPAGGKLALAGLAGAIVFFLVRNFAAFRFPDTQQAKRRLEQDAGLKNRPMDLLGETLAAGRGDAVAEALWRAHAQTSQGQFAKIRLPWPHLSLAARDPLVLRFVVLLLIGTGWWIAGPDASSRLARALSLDVFAGAAQSPRIDAWIDPPAYTKLPPLFIPSSGSAERNIGPVPIGSHMTLRVQGIATAPRLRIRGWDGRPSEKQTLAADGEQRFRATTTLKQNSDVTVRGLLSALARYHIAVTKDVPPSINFVGPVAVTAQKGLRLTYRALDDYGIAHVKLRLAQPGKLPSAADNFDLPRPAGDHDSLERTNLDLTAHPYAGLAVDLQLLAFDGAGQEGRSGILTMILPERGFANPLARALVAARREMMRARARIGAAANVIDEVSQQLAGQDPIKNGLVLALRSAFWSLADSADGQTDTRPHAAELMWNVAVALEDGASGEAKAQLETARRALSDALKSGASQAEIASRMAALRKALGRYLGTLQEKFAQGEQQPNAAARAITPRDFKRLMDMLENLTTTGAKEDAQNLLSALEDILQNLNTGSPSSRAAGSALDKALQNLSELIGQQRRVLDETYRAVQSDQERERSSKALQGLAQRQENLRRDLGQAMTDLSERVGAIPKPLGEAERAMNSAREALDKAGGRGAIDRQQRALDQLEKGARELAQQQGQGSGGAKADSAGAPALDPFGRPNAGLPDNGDTVKVPDASEAQRARAILEEIRRRAAERGRPSEELRYLDRLLQQF